jgi:hypothetical protein
LFFSKIQHQNNPSSSPSVTKCAIVLMSRKKTKAPAVEGSHTFSQVDGSSKLQFASTSTKPPSRTRQNGLHNFARIILLMLAVMLISSVLYTVAEPHLDPQLANIMNTPSFGRSLSLVASRSVALYIAYELGFDGMQISDKTSI